MRAVWGILSLAIVLLIVGILVKKQMTTTTAPIPDLQVPAANPSASGPVATQREQAQQIQQQIKQTIDAQLQTPRDMPADAK